MGRRKKKPAAEREGKPPPAQCAIEWLRAATRAATLGAGRDWGAPDWLAPGFLAEQLKKILQSQATGLELCE
jgi:hypothetical protein